MTLLSEGILSCTEVARRLDLDKATVRQWLREGKLPGFKVGTGWLIREEDLPQAVGSK